MPDGSKFDGKHLLSLVRGGDSPFGWGLNLLIRDIEDNIDTQVVDILVLTKGSNKYVSSWLKFP